MPRLTTLATLLHRAGAVVGLLTALVGLALEQQALLPPHVARWVVVAGTVLAACGRALRLIETAVVRGLLADVSDGARVQAAIQGGADATASDGGPA